MLLLTEREWKLFPWVNLTHAVLRIHWARYQIDAISECSTIRDIKATLKNLPKDMNEIYERILQKIMDKGESTAVRAEKILMWLAGSMRPLQLL